MNWPSNDDNFMSGVREIGERFSYSFYDQEHDYYIDEEYYDAQLAFEDSLNIGQNWGWNGNSNSSRYFLQRQTVVNSLRDFWH